jgi:signal transduction histidine kinase
VERDLSFEERDTMDYTESLEKFIPRTRRAFGMGVGVALGVLAVTVFSGWLFVRSLVREQIIRRDAEALYATTLMEQIDLVPEDGIDIRTDMQIGFDAAIRASRLRGVMGIRFFDEKGMFNDTFPATIMPQPLDLDAFDAVRRFTPYGIFKPDTGMDSIFVYLPQFATGKITRVDTLEITIPLHQRDIRELAGAAQFIIEGESIAAEFSRLDRRLIQIACATFAVSGMLLTAMLWPAFRRAQKLNRKVALHSERLQRANEELALMARTSAVGAVSAHLIHGLKNPLASLSQFVSRNDPASAEADEQDWQDALTASRRMQTLVERTMEVLCDVRGEAVYELTVPELCEDLKKRMASPAAARKVKMVFRAEGNCTMSSRTANLASLVLINLLENAIEATHAGGTVSLLASKEDDRLCFRVRDEGSGYPGQQIDHLFLPVKSSREGGSGIGLAISKQIADYLDATLKLEESSEKGCVFLFELSIAVCRDATR